MFGIGLLRRKSRGEIQAIPQEVVQGFVGKLDRQDCRILAPKPAENGFNASPLVAGDIKVDLCTFGRIRGGHVDDLVKSDAVTTICIRCDFASQEFNQFREHAIEANNSAIIYFT